MPQGQLRTTGFFLVLGLFVAGSCGSGALTDNHRGDDTPTEDATEDTTSTTRQPGDPVPGAPCMVETGTEDQDGDGAANATDNCPCAANPGQADRDGDQVGDACDNCPGVANYDQADQQQDGVGDECEARTDPARDRDGDGISDFDDNCWLAPNDDQADQDADKIGDACDNCVSVANYDQADDGRCEPTEAPDTDGDGVGDATDTCPQVANSDQRDSDHDGVGDACDNCPTTANHDQADRNADGKGDTCDHLVDPDYDHDRTITELDNCPKVANADQADSDGDGRGNACDNCPSVDNWFQEDVDGDGLGDHCDPVLTFPPSEPICAEGSSVSKTLKPNLYLLLDTSSSMKSKTPSGESRWEFIEKALDQMASVFTRSFRVAMGTFPGRLADGYNVPVEKLTPSENWSVTQFRDAYDLQPVGDTPMTNAINGFLDGRASRSAGDSFAAARSSYLVLLTDGNPSHAGDSVSKAAAAIRASARAGIPVFLIGITGVSEDSMDTLAQNSGTDNPLDSKRRWFSADDSAALTAAFQAIENAAASCSLVLSRTRGTPDYGRVSVTQTVNGASTLVPRGRPHGWTISLQSQPVVQLHGDSCEALREVTSASAARSATVEVACESECGSSREICGNYIDDNCDGRTDEGCNTTCHCSATETCGGRCPPLVTRCTAEVCDGVDNDCDGTVDEGCCDASEELCDDGLDNNCNGLVDEGCGCGPEICDDIDNDCDGAVDEGCPAVLH